MLVLWVVFEQWGICCWVLLGSEVDDFVVILVVKVVQVGYQVIIVFIDKGYCQLLLFIICICDYFQKCWLDVFFIVSEFGVILEQLVDYWGLVGISSLKVLGVVGIGFKSVVQLLNEFQDLEGLYVCLVEVLEKWCKKLVVYQEMVFICWEVVCLQIDFQLDGNLQQLWLMC